MQSNSHIGAQSQRGFTLIELMITVVIIGILSAIVVPMYGDYVTRGKIPEATSALAGMRVQLEQYYQDNRDYGADDERCGVAAPAAGNFTYSCTGTAQTYKIVATGIAARGMGDFQYTIDQTGKRTTDDLPTGWGTAPVNCWVTRKGGGC